MPLYQPPIAGIFREFLDRQSRFGGLDIRDRTDRQIDCLDAMDEREVGMLLLPSPRIGLVPGGDDSPGQFLKACQLSRFLIRSSASFRYMRCGD